MLKKLVNLGVLPEMNELFVKRLKAINIMLFVCASNCLIYGFVLWSLGMSEISLIIFAFSLVFYLLILLQAKKKSNFVRSLLLVFLNLFILFFRIILNKAVEIELLFSLLIILPLLFYQYHEIKQWIIFSVFSVVLLVISFILPEYNLIALESEQLVLVKSLVWLTFFIWISVLFYWVHFEYGKTEMELTAKNKSLKELLSAYQKNEQELISLNTTINQRYQELEHIIQIVSHDLKEPVQTIVTGCDIIQSKEIAPEDKKEIGSAMQFAKEELNHMYDGIIRYSSVCQQREINNVQLNDVLNYVTENNKKLKQLKIIAPNLPSVRANNEDITMLFNELINNSMCYNLNEQILIHIQVIRSSDKKMVTLEYTDNSIGFKSTKVNVFKIFFRQIHNGELSRRGVGLAIIKKIITFYGGNIRNKDCQNGVKYIVTLPKA